MHTGLFPTELLLSIFTYLDGPTLISCSKVCQKWHSVVSNFDNVIWPNVCRCDFQKTEKRRFWPLYFPEPTHKRSWQDMYRITRNWYQGNCVGYYAHIDSERRPEDIVPCRVVGSPLDQGLSTLLTLTLDGSVVRSNPYYFYTLRQSLVIQPPNTTEIQPLQWINQSLSEMDISHTISCHFTSPSSNWLVTGALDGTVAVWDIKTQSLISVSRGHQGRVLCVSMNDKVVLSGGCDNTIQVWGIDSTRKLTRHGGIDASRYLSERSAWYQGIGEIVIHHDLVVCAPDAAGPILIFSLSTGSLVYELKPQDTPEDMSAFSRLCLTPYFLLARGKVSSKSDVKVAPSHHNVLLQRKEIARQSPKPGYLLTDDSPAQHMTPYQLSVYYQSQYNNSTAHEKENQTLACIHVWDIQTGKIAYQLLPILSNPDQYYTILDIQLAPDYSKVFASIQTQTKTHTEERLYCWDFSSKTRQDSSSVKQDFKAFELDGASQHKMGKSWVCFT